MIDLYRLDKERWVVAKNSDEILFPKIEGACNHLMELGVLDDEIDYALADMASFNHCHAQFGINGFFIFSDNRYLIFNGGST
jgi:hypothetical protein